MKQAAALLRSAIPDQWQAAFSLEKLAKRVEEGNARKILKEEAVNALAGVQRVGPMLGPNTQERLQELIEPLVHRMGLAADVAVASDTRQQAGARR
jgi:hypothetical protein